MHFYVKKCEKRKKVRKTQKNIRFYGKTCKNDALLLKTLCEHAKKRCGQPKPEPPGRTRHDTRGHNRRKITQPRALLQAADYGAILEGCYALLMLFWACRYFGRIETWRTQQSPMTK